ncbi:MAG: GtrA family protein [Leptolyngbyaceae cyanobacterium SL_1_1]|nr:GtrA family protein [Leptolyngbyaceae cyanobacterium RM1_1_2]NJO08559.1 GtrA family protein [Leptolyngbyaceae cyanobacterium SL_1_1]
MRRQFLKNKKVRFLICGSITAAFNLAAISVLVALFAAKTPLLRNLANVTAIEISLLFSFFVYRLGVWPQASWQLKPVLLYQLPMYHLSAAIVIIARSFLIFPVLDWLGVHYLVNTLLGIALGAGLTYCLGERVIFTVRGGKNIAKK